MEQQQDLNNLNESWNAQGVRAKALHERIGELPTPLINLVGLTLTDSWTPLVDSPARQNAQEVRARVLRVEYPEDRLRVVAGLTDGLMNYAEPWGARGLAIESSRIDVVRDFGQWADCDEDLARVYCEMSRSYETYKWLTESVHYGHQEAMQSLQDPWQFTTDALVLPTARHILCSRPTPVLPVIRTTTRQRADLISALRAQQWMILALKAYFFMRLTELPGAEAARYDSVVEALEGAGGLFWFKMVGVCGVVENFLYDLAEIWSQKPGAMQQWAEICLVVYVWYRAIRILVKAITRPQYTLRPKEEDRKDHATFVKHEMTPNGWEYEFLYKGETIRCSDNRGLNQLSAAALQDEMALPGSATHASKKQPVGGIFVATADTELAQVGCFWRHGDYLVTARHVANAIDSGVATAYLAGVSLDAKNKARTNLKSMLLLDDDFFSDDNNFNAVDLDVFTRKLTPGQWSRLPGIEKTNASKKSQYDQVVNAVGYHGDLLVTSSGKTLQGSGPIYLWHTASTQKGFSGSPIFSGKYVVGMHIAAHDVPVDRKNVAIRIEAIKHWALPDEDEAQDYTSDSPDIEHDEQGFKFNGHRATIEQYQDEFIYLSREGLAWYGYDEKDVRANNPTYFSRDEEDDAIDEAWQRSKTSKRIVYNDENADIPKTPAKTGLIQLPNVEPVYCARTEPEQPEAIAYLDKQTEKLTSLGYDATKYVWPDINKTTERKSLVKHLEKHVARAATIAKPPTDSEKDVVVAMVLAQLSANRYEQDPNYRTTANIKRILDSTLVKDSKSPGHPYQSAGMATNGKVLEQHGPAGFADIVLAEWDAKFDLKVFLKSEPTKCKKIDEEMPRVITGMPLHKMVKHQAIFEQLVATSVDNWGKSAVVGGFAPVVGGHIQNLADRFKGRKVYGSDKPCWDYMYHKYLFEILEEVLVLLPVQTDQWGSDEWEYYLADIRGAVREVSNDARYRCSDGTVWTTSMGGAMKSGWVLTFLANSIGQLIVDALVKVRMGVTLKESQTPEYAIMVGGDDVIQTFPEKFDLAKYTAVAAELGLELEEFETRPTFDGVEFFSHEFKLRRGVWEYHPTRFTKHVAKLRRTKIEHLPDALVNHMRNHLWDEQKYGFLRKMYLGLRKDHPTLFPLSKLKDRFELQMAVTGREASC